MLRTNDGAVAGAVTTAVMALEQPLDKRLCDPKYDGVEILGKLAGAADLGRRAATSLARPSES